MADRESLRAAALRHACELLAWAGGEGAPPAEPVEVTVGDGTLTVRVAVVRSSAQAGNGAAASRLAAGPHLTRLDREILEAASDQWQRKAQLAAACDGHDPDSYFAGRVRRLRNLGLLQADGEGRYRRA